MVAVVSAAVLTAGWWVSARRAADPVVPLALFRDAAFRASAGISALSGVVLFGSVVYLPLYLQNGLHLDALRSALCTVPLMLGISLGAQGVGRALQAGRSPALLAQIAGGLMAAGAAAVAVSLRLAPTPTWSVAAVLLPIGLGLGMCFPLTTIVAQRRASPTQLGAASALPVMLRTLGGALAVSLLGEGLRRQMGGAVIASPADATQALAAGTSSVFVWLAGAAAVVLALATRLQIASPETSAAKNDGVAPT